MELILPLGFLGSLGTTELLLVFFVVLILFGPKQLPQIARTLGKGLRDIRRAVNQIKHETGLDELDDLNPRNYRRSGSRIPDNPPATSRGPVVPESGPAAAGAAPAETTSAQAPGAAPAEPGPEKRETKESEEV